MSIKQYNLLIVDDDNDIRDLLGKFLTQHGYQTQLVANGADMMKALNKQLYDLIILDIMLPGDDGFTLCRKVRENYAIPIIMLTAVSEDTDRIVGLELGADDYLTKPFNPRELLARIKAVLRRVDNTVSHTIVHKNKRNYNFCGWQLNPVTRTLSSPDGLSVTVSSGEYDLLLAFLEHPQQVLSRDMLLDYTRNREAGPFDRSIDVQVSRLRQKIEKDPKQPQLIKTVRNIGYIFATDVKRL